MSTEQKNTQLILNSTIDDDNEDEFEDTEHIAAIEGNDVFSIFFLEPRL